MKIKKLRRPIMKWVPILAGIILFIFYIQALSAPADDIHEAAKQGDLTKVKTLLEKDPELIDAKDENGETPLFRASESGHKDIVEYLIVKGAQVNAQNNANQNALFYAAYYGQPEIVNLLLSKGADFKGVDRYGRSPLHYPAREGQKQVFK